MGLFGSTQRNDVTPIRRQYLQIKQRYPEAVLFFRLGDFYETFDEDAVLAAKELDIVLTSRSMGKGVRVPMAGIPAHALDSYLARLIKKGYRVAICEQLTEPSQSRGLVDRDVVRVVSPGTVLESSMLEQGVNNYLAAFAVENETAGLAYIDITTGEFRVTELGVDEVNAELHRLSPAEILISESWKGALDLDQVSVSTLDKGTFSTDRGRSILLEHFGVQSLEPFGCDEMPLGMGAAGAVLEYLDRSHKSVLALVSSLTTYATSTYMTLDPQTRRNLELFNSGRWGTGFNSLLSVLDFTKTPMGSRVLRRWVGQPLLRLDDLQIRQDCVEFFFSDLLRRERTRECLSRVADLERILGRNLIGRATPRDLLALKESLEAAVDLSSMFRGEDSNSVSRLNTLPSDWEDLISLINEAIEPDPQGDIGDGRVISHGYSDDLDHVRAAATDAKAFIAGLEQKERATTGIKPLKVGYNRVFGYYIEVSNSHLERVPDRYVRRQTLVNGERFITTELKEYESLVLNARERIQELEKDVYQQICGQVSKSANPVGVLAKGLAEIDAVASLAEAAFRHGYVRPILSEDGPLEIKEGRHPIVEQMIPTGSFVPNDIYLNCDDVQLMLITGPNMSGKSTFIRQVGLIVLMAQIGSFVPAESASIGLVDRIFTRVGLQDDLGTGQSTFMVEMVETAAILNQATRRSLVVLDEIGRGTSTYDGLSIARAVAEYVHNHPRLGCKTLFATHYHELTELALVLPRVRNHTVAVSENGRELLFLHRIIPGSADKSYGVHAAQLAGLPMSIVHRAWQILDELEASSKAQPVNVSRADRGDMNQQISFFSPSSPLLQELIHIDINGITPLDALNHLYRLQLKAKESW
ncbi:DNA mismatch repair protein MutS [SAR202 cluster bacterium AD-804-J14_MRT_500m]|nr:DNA mismatch repair protein MutS [SAR202 cluster bacterium AD-804-J14_MRT_500m]